MEPDGAYELVGGLVPYSRRLFQAINGFYQIETIKFTVDLDAFRDRAEDLFLHHAIDVCRNNVKFIQGPAEILR